MPKGAARRQGTKVGDGRCGPGARGEAAPVQIGPSKDETEDGRPQAAQDGDARRPRNAHPATGTASPGASPAASLSWPATNGAGRTMTGPLDGPAPGDRCDRGFRPGQADARRTARASVPLPVRPLTVSSGTAATASSKPAIRPYRHGSADRHRGAPPQGGALRPALEEKTRAERGDRTDGRPCWMRASGRASHGVRPVEPVGTSSTRMSRRAAGERGSTTVAGPLFGAS